MRPHKIEFTWEHLMILWLKPPESLVISKYIACYWFLEKTTDGNENAEQSNANQ